MRYFARRAAVQANPHDPAPTVGAALAQARANGGRVFVVGLALPAAGAPFTGAPAWRIGGEEVWEAR